MNKLFILIGALVFVLAGCEQDTEFPLILPAAAEPSSKMYNDRGIDYYRKGNYREAVIAFVQARTAGGCSVSCSFPSFSNSTLQKSFPFDKSCHSCQNIQVPGWELFG
jgi:hypothetical protein